jgi:hypothetical protein
MVRIVLIYDTNQLNIKDINKFLHVFLLTKSVHFTNNKHVINFLSCTKINLNIEQGLTILEYRSTNTSKIENRCSLIVIHKKL